MRPFVPITMLAVTALAHAQNPGPTPTEELRATVREWVETMQKIQQEENDWLRDQEVLRNYKEGLEKESADLKEQISAAKTRQQGADKESSEKVAERDRFAAAKDELSTMLRGLEEAMEPKLAILPEPLLKEPKVAQAVEDFRRDFALPADQRNEGVSKRLLNLLTLVGEVEKFQQTVHVRAELHRDSQGREFNMKTIYFGLGAAYAVNDDGSFALVGRPTSAGWKFEDRKDQAENIRQLIAATTGDQDAAFVNLPLAKP